MTVDSPIYLLNDAGSLTGGEYFVLDQFPYGVPGSTVKLSLSGLLAYVTDNIVVSGNLTGSLTTGYYPVATGANSLDDGRVHHDSGTTYIDSPTVGNGLIAITNTDLLVKHRNGSYISAVYLTDSDSELNYTDGTNVAHINLNGSYSEINHNLRVNLNAPAVRLNQLTVSTVPYLDANKDLRSSAVSPTALGYVSTLTSPAQAQIDALSSLVVGSMNLRGAYTPSGGNYPTTGGSGTSGAVKKGNYWVASGITGSGSTTIGTQTINNKDSLIALVDLPGQTDANWEIVEGNIGYVPLNQNLTSAYIYVGNASNIGTGVPLTGPIGVTNTGLTFFNGPVSIANGGTATATGSQKGSVFIAGIGGIHTNDFYNLNYDVDTKRLNVNNINIIPDDTVPGINIEGAGNGLVITALDAGYEAIVINALGGGIKVDSASGIAGKYSSSEYPGEFNQNGIITVNNDFSAISINRSYTRASTGSGSTSVASGPLLYLNDTTVPTLGTGAFIKCVKKNTDGTPVNRFEVGQDGKSYYQLQASIKVSIAGSYGFDVSKTQSIAGSGATDIFTRSIKANSLDAIGDEFVGVYHFTLAEAVKLKTFVIYLGGTTLYSTPAFALTGSSGSATIEVRIIKDATNSVSYKVTVWADDGTGSTPLLFKIKTGSTTPTLTSANTLRVSGVCDTGSLAGDITGSYAKYFLNPEV